MHDDRTGSNDCTSSRDRTGRDRSSPPSPSPRRQTLHDGGEQLRRAAREIGVNHAGVWKQNDGSFAPIVAVDAPDNGKGGPRKSNTGSTIVRSEYASRPYPVGVHGLTRTSGTQRASVKNSGSNYYSTLRVDTLKLAARVPSDSMERVGRDWHALKEEADRDEAPVLDTHDGTELEVQLGNAHSERRQLKATGDSITLTALAMAPNVCDLAFTFHAEACWNGGPRQLVQWARDFCTYYALPLEETLISRLDLCVDLDMPFVEGDRDGVRGHCPNDWASYQRDGRFTGFHSRRSPSRPVCLRVYDKRVQAEESGAGGFWQAVWEDADVGEERPVWRVEYESRRDRLRERGLATWQDLTRDRIERYWSYLTEEYARMENDIWDEVQGASTEDAADREEAESVFDPDMMEKQILGLARRISEETGEPVPNILDRLKEEE